MDLKDFPRRGEIFLLARKSKTTEEKSKNFPVLIVSNDVSNEYSDTVTIVPLVKTEKKTYPFEVPILQFETGLKQKTKALCNHVFNLDKSNLKNPVGKLSHQTLLSVNKALKIHLGM